MKLNHLFEETFDEKAAWDYLYRDPLFEMHRKEFSTFLHSKEGQIAKYKSQAFLEKLGDDGKTEFFSDNNYLEHITFSGNVLNSSLSLEFYHYDDLGGEPPFKIGSVRDTFSVQSAKTLTELPNWFPEKCKRLFLDQAGITSFHNIHKIVNECERITLKKCPVKSSIVGLVLIKGLKKVDFGITDEMINDHPKDGAYDDLENIIIRNLQKNPKDALEFQDELIDNGWEEYAKL